MAEHSHDANLDMAAHRETYEGFVRGTIALLLLVGFTCVALVMFAFGESWSVLLGFLGLLLGTLAIVVDLRSKRWTLSLVLLVIFGLVTAVNVS